MKIYSAFIRVSPHTVYPRSVLSEEKYKEFLKDETCIICGKVNTRFTMWPVVVDMEFSGQRVLSDIWGCSQNHAAQIAMRYYLDAKGV